MLHRQNRQARSQRFQDSAENFSALTRILSKKEFPASTKTLEDGCFYLSRCNTIRLDQ
jgi:hypothetical protein